MNSYHSSTILNCIMNQLITCILIILVSQSPSHDATLLPLAQIQTVEGFFPEINGNLTAVTWFHAVNSLELLNQSLMDDVMMLEADVVLGTLKSDQLLSEMPIMAHPPNVVSDLSLEMFLTAIIDFNKLSKMQKKGVKLDFKTIEAFEESVNIIKQLQNQIDFSLWLNADILPGPLDANDLPIDPERFINKAHDFENAVLSLGWRTRYGNEITKANYSETNIDKMVVAIKENLIEGKQPPNITFPVRAGIAAQSIPQLLRILKEVKDSTLTLWGSESDPVDVESLRKLIGAATIKNVYVDLPKSLLDKLRLDELNSGGTFKPLAFLTAALAFMLKVF